MCVIRVPHCESNRLFPIRTWTDPMANRRLLTPRSAATCATRRARDLRSVPPSTRYRPPRRWPRQSWRRPNKSPRARALPRVSLALLVRALCTMESIHVYVIPRDRVRTCTCTPDVHLRAMESRPRGRVRTCTCTPPSYEIKTPDVCVLSTSTPPLQNRAAARNVPLTVNTSELRGPSAARWVRVRVYG